MRMLQPCIVVLLLNVCVANSSSAEECGSMATVAGWTEMADSLRDLPARLLAHLPLSMQNDPQVQQEVARLALQAFTSSAIDALGGDPDYPEFLPQIGQLLNVGQPNADTVYRVARVAADGVYRLRGHRGSLRMANISQVGSPSQPGAKSSQAAPPRTVLDLNALKVDEQGYFDVLLSATRPEGYKGDWWPMQPNTSRLLLRLVSSDWGRERDPTLAIERVDKPARRSRPSAADLEQRLRQLPAATEFIALMFIDHVEQLRREGFVNKLKVFDTSQIGGLADQFYYEGAYELRDDEALIVSARVPERCLYRSIILTTALYQTTNWYDNHSSLNDSQAQPDPDGVLRIVVSAQDPGVRNWLDTAGHPTGVIQGRWFQCDSQPVPTVVKVPVAEVRNALPATTPTVTPAQREQLIRARRLALQQRRLW